MKIHLVTSLLALAAVSGGAQAASLPGNVSAFSLGDDGTTLVQLAGPGGVGAVAIRHSEGAQLSLDTITYRPVTGQLYGYDDNTDTVFVIDTMTGVAMPVTSGAMPNNNGNLARTNSNDVGFDFNNQIDAARLVTAEEDNRVFRPNAVPADIIGLDEGVMDLAYGAGDPNEGQNPNVVMNAYTNAVPGMKASTTAQFVLDSDWNLLATLANNAGTLGTVGMLTLDDMEFDITETGGFDILSAMEGDNTAYALLTGSDGMQGIYEVPLMADMMGNVSLTFISAVTTDYGPLNGFALAGPGILAAPGSAPVPVPAGVLLLGGGVAALIAKRRLSKQPA